MKIKSIFIILTFMFGGVSVNANEKKLNESIELKKGDKIEIRDLEANQSLNIEFLGAGYEEGDDNYHASTASFKLNYGNYREDHLLIESFKGAPGKKRFENFMIVLEYSDGLETCKIRISKQ